MDYEAIYTKDYFSGKTSFFYRLGYGVNAEKYFSLLYAPLKPHVKPGKNARALDVGCAYGFMLDRLPKQYQKFGVDISAYAIDQARKRYPNVTYKIGNAEQSLPFSDQYFSIVLLNDILEHVEHPKKLLQHVYRILAKNGIIYISTPNANIVRKIVFGYGDKKEHHISLFPYQDLIRLLRANNFSIVQSFTFTDLCFIKGLGFIHLPRQIATETCIIAQK